MIKKQNNIYTFSYEQLPHTVMKIVLEKDITDTRLILLEGDMGTGKTSFTKTLVSLFNPDIIVSSPTYSYMNEYHIDENFTIWHYDLYRCEKNIPFCDIYDQIHSQKGIVVIEWPEKFPDLYNFQWTLVLQCYYIDEITRSIEVKKS